MKVALLGFSQSGKSTLFSAVSGKSGAPSGSARIEEAVVPVSDERLDWLTALYEPKKTVPATIDCLDVPGLSYLDASAQKTARATLREVYSVDMYVLVVRAFDNPAVPMYRGSVDPVRDIEELQLELIFSDLELVSTRIERLEAQIKKAPKTVDQDKIELSAQQKLQVVLEAEKPASSAELSEQELAAIRSLGLLTRKPLMVVVNADDPSSSVVQEVAARIDTSIPVIGVNAKIEQELQELDAESRAEFMADLGIREIVSEAFIRSCYTATGLISFLTVGTDEVRAWPIRVGTSALDAAGKVHSDIRRGFIRAETMSYTDLYEAGSEKALRAAGKARLEGKEYIVQDGDIINFRFNA